MRERRPGSWAVLGAYVALVAASHVLWISFATVTGRAAAAFHTTDVSIGLLISVGPLCSAALSIPGGVVADRYGYRTPLLWAGLATSLFAFLRPLAGGLPALLLLTVGLLLPQPFLINAVADLVNRHFPEEEAATATGLGTMAIFLGITLGLVVTPGLATALGVRGSQVAYAAASLVALLVFWRLAPRPVPDRLVSPEELSVRRALARVMRSATQWKLSAALFLGFGLYLGTTTWLEEMLKPRGIDEAGAGAVAGTITIAGMVGSVVLGAA
ncbi:MAG TPA: MFS transporter, partial [Actinomycetes bacterium]